MKRKTFIKGLLVLGVLVGLAAPKVANADTGMDPYDSKNVVLKGFEDYDTVSVDIEWGEMEFEYSEEMWVPAPTSYDATKASNYIQIKNNSKRPLRAGVWFVPNVYRLASYVDGYLSRDGDGSCISAKDKILYSNAWSENKQNGGYVFKTNPSDVVIYEDGNCEVQVAKGAAYDSNKTYYYVELYKEFAGSSYENGADIVIPGVTRTYEGIVGSQYNPSAIASTGTFAIELYGGDYSEIQYRFNNNKKIGTVNLWLYSIGD